MSIHIQFLIHYGYALLFGWVFAEQMGLPIPSIPILLTAGALVGTHDLRAAPALAFPIVAAITADVIWYQLGRHKGIRILQFLCKISLEPDSFVRRTENVFARSGAKSLLVAKFIPGLNTAAQPLAGIFRMKFGRFVIFDAAGAAIYVGTVFGLGYAFSGQIERVAGAAARLGVSIVAVLL